MEENIRKRDNELSDLSRQNTENVEGKRKLESELQAMRDELERERQREAAKK